MPRVFHKRSGSWVEIKSIFQRRSGSWVEILNVFRRVSGTWVKVFSASKIPGNTVAPTITGTGYLFSTLTNNSLGTWTNSPTSYTRQWRRGNPAADGGEPSSYSNISGATSSTYTTTSTDNGKYIICQVTATNALGSNSAASNPIYVKKYAPVALGTYSVSGGLLVGSTLTATVQIGTWKNTTNNTDDTYPDTFIYEWSDTNGNILQETSSNTYLILSGDLNKTLRLRVKGINTGGEEYTSYQSLGTVTDPYRFSFGKNLYVSSNGHIGLDSGSSSYTSMSSGRNIAIFVKDLQQYYLAEYSDSSVYYLYIKSYLYNTSASSVNALDYQIKFYNDASINYCDVYIVRKGSNVSAIPDISTGYYSSGTTGYASMVGPYSISQGTVFRVYFGDQAGTTSGIPWTSVNNNLWDVIQTWDGQGAGGLGIDDTFTTVTSAANQSAPFPTNTVAPTLTTDTGNFSAGSTITLNTGTWNNASSYGYEILYGTSTPIATDSTATKTLINTNQYVITNSDAVASSYYFRGRVTGYLGTGQTGNSAQAFTTTSARSTLNPTTTISVGTSTETGFTISGTAGPLSGFGTTYVNVTEIQIYNSSQSLVSTITTGLPTVNGTTGAWSYVWTGHSGAQATYYAKVKVTATDSDQTTFTTGFSSSISTLAALSSPTISSVSYSTSNNTWTVNYTGGSGPYYQIWYQPSSSSTGAPTLNGDATSIADASSSDSSSTSRVLTPSSGFVYWWWVRSAKTLNATGAGNVSAWNGPVTMSPMNTAIPTLTGTAKVGQTLTYGIGTWINSSSQDLRLYRGTASVATSETLAASSTSTSATYTIPSSDFTDPNNRKYYRSFANVSNPSFSSGFVAGTEIGPLVNVTLYTITFDSQGGTSVSSLTQSTEGGSIAKPTDPTRSGYSFGGWATSSTGTTAVSWPRTPSSDETLYAIWSQNVVAPSAPSSVSWGTHSYAYVSGSLSTTLSPSASGNATKVQSWTYQSRVTFNYSWSSVTGATSYEVFTSSSSTAPTSTSTGTDVGNTTTGSFTAVQTNRGTLNRYAWVRAVNSAGKSGWTAAGLTTSTATVVSGLSTAGNVKICRTNTTTCTNASGVLNTDISYTYSGVNTGFSHVAYLSNITISGTTGLSANS